MVAPARRPLRSSLEGGAGMSAWEPVIGLEMHVELDTRTKMFCACEVTKGDEPNTHTCPKCLAHPGALPVVNQRAGVRETLGTGVRVGLVALGDLAGAEHLGARVELHVHLELSLIHISEPTRLGM